ncbi:helix-turn-helix protein [Georgenia muralis]|uniref:Helix-turn-helix protein n=2 Tax=Georgenia muralis TaxID=154117 RepID=A0A3N5A975_9MICO|nr:helix-turn-helix protein [Georgenia muralis]
MTERLPVLSHGAFMGHKPLARGPQWPQVHAELRSVVRAGLSEVDGAAHLRCMTTNSTPGGGLEPLMSIDALSELLGVPVNTIKDWRTKGQGPVAYKIGNHLRYAAEDVRTWLERCREEAAGVAPPPGRR